MAGARRLYRLHLAFAVAGVAAIAGGVAAVAAAAQFALPSAEAIRRACESWLSAGGPGALLGLAISVLALTVFALAVRSARRQIRASRRYVQARSIMGEIVIDSHRCWVVEGSAAEAFCAGYLRPRIYLSRGAIDGLDRSELLAVVAHEAHHLKRRDPLRLLLARALADGLFFIPILGRTVDRYAALEELAADEAAVATVRSRKPLAAALLKFGAREPSASPVVGIAPERVDHLMGDPGAARWSLPRSHLSWSAAALLGLFGLVFLLGQGVLNPTLELALLLAAGCMALWVVAPVFLALTVLRLSRRTLATRRG